MLNNKYLLIISVWLISLVSICSGQFVEVNVYLDLRRLSEGERQLFTTMTEDMQQYFLNSQFTPDIADMKMIIDRTPVPVMTGGVADPYQFSASVRS